MTILKVQPFWMLFEMNTLWLFYKQISVPELCFMELFAALGKPSTIIDHSAPVENEILTFTMTSTFDLDLNLDLLHPMRASFGGQMDGQMLQNVLSPLIKSKTWTTITKQV